MAARLRIRHQDDIRKKIQAIKLIDILQKDAMNVKPITDGQRQSAKILLDKSVSNAPHETRIGNPDGTPILTGINVGFIDSGS